MQEAATKVASEISSPDFIKKKRNACPTAARKADTKTAFRDGFEMTAKPIAAIAASNPSKRTKRNIFELIIFPILRLTLQKIIPKQYKQSGW